jgi:hypothetical protein
MRRWLRSWLSLKSRLLYSKPRRACMNQNLGIGDRISFIQINALDTNVYEDHLTTVKSAVCEEVLRLMVAP